MTLQKETWLTGVSYLYPAPNEVEGKRRASRCLRSDRGLDLCLSLSHLFRIGGGVRIRTCAAARAG